MDPNELPASERTALTDGLLAALASGAGAHTRARFHVDLEGTEDKLEISSVRGGALKSADPEASSKGEFVGEDVSDAYRALLLRGVATKRPLHMIHYDFWLESGTWKYVLTVQSLAEYDQMVAERAAVDDAMESALIEAAGKGWKRILSSRSDRPPLQKLKVGGYYGKERRELPISGAVQTAVDKLWAFHRERGFKLESMHFGLDAGPRKHKRNFTVYYVPEQRT